MPNSSPIAFLAKKPKILLLDEPATMACPATKQEILDTFKKANRETGLTMLCASHLPEVHRYLVDRLIWLDDGKVILEGDPEYVLSEFLKELPDPIPLAERGLTGMGTITILYRCRPIPKTTG